MNVTGVGVTAGAGAANSSAQLAQTFDSFLKLLTAQLQNQDPLEPMDSNEFTTQLVQFSGVEQSINTNRNLETLIALMQGRASTDAISYLGRSVAITDGRAELSDGEARWGYALAGQSALTTLTVTDAQGRVVYTGAGEKGAGGHEFVWDGRDNSGTALSNGVYKLSVAARSPEGTAIPTAVSSKGTVDEIDLTGNEPLLMIGTLSVPLSRAAAVSTP